jgi:hypothetical protein
VNRSLWNLVCIMAAAVMSQSHLRKSTYQYYEHYNPCSVIVMAPWANSAATSCSVPFSNISIRTSQIILFYWRRYAYTLRLLSAYSTRCVYCDKYGGLLWTGFIWLKSGACVGLLWARSIELWDIFVIAEELLASQGLSFVKIAGSKFS